MPRLKDCLPLAGAAVLSPLLLAQALHVRRVTPRLPEAAGPRRGEAGQGPLLRLLILGDSAAAGVGVAEQSEALSGQLLRLLTADFRVHWMLHAQSGFKTADLLRNLGTLTPVPVDAVVTSLGVNDVTGATRRQRWQQLQAELIETLKQRFEARLILLSAVPPMHRFPALPQPLRQTLGWRARRLNATLAELAAAQDGVELCQIPFPPNPVYMAEDGFHPGPRAYALWAEALAIQIRAKFSPARPQAID